MKKSFVAVLALVAVASGGGLLPLPASAQSQSAAASTCSNLAYDYDRTSKKLAKNYAKDLSDKSVPRITMRAMENNNHLITAQITLELMQAKKCAVPARAPLGEIYIIEALACRTEELKGNPKSEKCDSRQWTGNK